MKFFVFLFAFTVSFFIFKESESRDHRVTQIPNGNKLQCLNCHISSLGGGQLNAFGQEILSNHLTTPNAFGNVKWSAALASIDSDNDGFTNGQELLDPSGSWTIGQPNPGNSANVTNPGNINSFPTSIQDIFTKSNGGMISISEINPNPAIDAFKLTFDLKKDSYISIELFDITGKVVANLYNSFLISGSHSFTFNPESISKMSLISGNYILSVRSENSFDTKSFKIAK